MTHTSGSTMVADDVGDFPSDHDDAGYENRPCLLLVDTQATDLGTS